MRNSELLHARGLCLDAAGGRPLLRDLTVSVGRGDRVAVVGRNGVGKSSLLEVLGGVAAPTRGDVVCHGRRVLVPQLLAPSHSESPGQLRRSQLEQARRADPELLLLDEPTCDLDREGMAWLSDWLAAFRGALVVVSHERSLLRTLREFFLMAEIGCRHLSGDFATVMAQLGEEETRERQRYTRHLGRLLAAEQHHERLERRRQRKKNLGRLHELKRCPSRAKLNEKRSYKQVSQGKRAVLQKARRTAAQQWTKAARRALTVELPLEQVLPELPERREPALILEGVAAEASGRVLFQELSLVIARERVAICGPNGAGKSRLLEIIAGEGRASRGQVRRQPERIGYVAQNAENWRLAESLSDVLSDRGASAKPEQIATILQAHKFPLALAGRALRSLSPGERLRAALICLCERRPAPDLLVLDEPTQHLDFLGAAALESWLLAWPGGLVLASHDLDLLAALDCERTIELAPAGPPTSASPRWTRA